MSSKNIVLDQDVVVTQLQGKVYLIAADGSQTLLSEGDVLPKDAVLLAPEGASFQGGETTFTLSPSNTPEAEEPQLAQQGQANVPDDIAALQQAILAGTDPTQTFEASAAGGAPATGNIGGIAGASGNGGFVTIDRTGDSTIAAAGFDTATQADTGVIGDAFAGEEDQLIDLVPPVITVSAPDNTNDTTPTLTGTTDAPAGSTVTLLVTDANGNQQTLTTTVNPDGTFSVDVTTPLADGFYTVTANVTDPAGNTGTAADDGSVDTTANITVSLDDVNGGNVGNAPISGTSDVGPGRAVTLVITDANGKSVTVSAQTDADGNYSTTADLSGLADGNLTVEASATDAAGNRADARDDTTLLDTTAPDARIALDADITPDDIINAAEAGQQIPVTGRVGGDVKVGDTVTLTVNGKTFTGLVLADKTFSINVPGSDLVADSGKLITASVTTTDAAGNSATATDSEGYSVDITAPSVVVDLVDDKLTVGETSEVTFTFSEKVTGFELADLTVVGGTVTGLISSDGGKTWSATFTPDANFEGTASVAVKPESYTDLAGNKGTGGSDSATMGDTTATGAPTVVITEDVNNDGTISNSEIDGKVDVEVSLPKDAKAGDTLKVSGQADRLLTDADITAGKVGYEFDRPADGVKLTVTATLVDAAGNVSLPGSDSATMGDTTATGAPTVVITEDVNNDGTISNSEIDGKVDVEVSLPKDAKAGDTLKVSGQADRLLTDADITAGKVGYEFDRPADGVKLTVTATLVDAAGNVSLPGSDSATMGDTTATGAPT
ncbi:retention module-containing protein, partial [Aeromonas media]|uniref:retention module-containing protein n=1 Tax=Aeromonas media TaxID=651 RepID=UPI003CFF1368